MRFVSSKYGVSLDGSSDTLSILDQYVRDARSELAARPESLPLLQATIGAYFGEVVRAAFGAHWFSQGDHDGWRLDLLTVYLTLNPIGVAREALLHEEAEGWHAYFEVDDAEKDAIDRRLAALPAIEPDEYYAPSTRFDVLSFVVEALRASMQESGLANVRFGPDDYRKR